MILKIKKDNTKCPMEGDFRDDTCCLQQYFDLL